jgi:hypothetical protein
VERVIGEPLDPFRYLDRRILAAAAVLENLRCILVDAREELRVEWTCIVEDFGGHAVTIGTRVFAVDKRLVPIELGPICVVAGRGRVGGCNDGKDAARICERRFNILRSCPKLTQQNALPGRWLGIGIVEEATPDAVAVQIFLPVPAGFQRGVLIGAAAASDAGTTSSLE